MIRHDYNLGKDGIGLGFSGYYKVQVVHAKTGEVVEDRPWKKNLILNVGMNGVATNAVSNLNAYGIAGTGTRTNLITGSTSTITQSNEIVYLYERTGLSDFTSSHYGYTNRVQAGDEIQYANGSRSFVITVIDGFNLRVRPSQSVDLANSQSFTIWKTSQTALQNEVKRSVSYLAGSSSIVWNCGTEFHDNTVIHRRTYNFSEETGPVIYSEAGVGWVSYAAANSTFCRVNIDPTLLVTSEHLLRLVHDLYVTYTPNSERYITASIGGWSVPPLYATESIQNFNAGGYSCISVVDTNGSTYGAATIDPATAGNNSARGYVSANSDVLANYTGSFDRSSGSVMSSTNVNSSYVADSWRIYKSCSYDLYEAVNDSWRIIGMGYADPGYPLYIYPWQVGKQGMTLKLDSPQTKTNEQKMVFMWKWIWDRTLS